MDEMLCVDRRWLVGLEIWMSLYEKWGGLISTLVITEWGAEDRESKRQWNWEGRGMEGERAKPQQRASTSLSLPPRGVGGISSLMVTVWTSKHTNFPLSLSRSSEQACREKDAFRDNVELRTSSHQSAWVFPPLPRPTLGYYDCNLFIYQV